MGTAAEDLPDRAREYLRQAIESEHAPSGSIMLSASAVDAMLKALGLRQGTLYSRIDEAAKQHLITEEMANWAHEVRLDANEQRHDDDEIELPDREDASRAINFVVALGDFLFVLPATVKRGRRAIGGDSTENDG